VLRWQPGLDSVVSVGLGDTVGFVRAPSKGAKQRNATATMLIDGMNDVRRIGRKTWTKVPCLDAAKVHAPRHAQRLLNAC
jgi:hypothetical protein